MIPFVSYRKADIVSFVVFIAGMAIVVYNGWWWPGTLLPILAALLVRQYLRGRLYDMVLTAFVFFGLFTYFAFNMNWAVVMPVLFTVGGIYLVFREYAVYKERVGIEKIIDAEKDLIDAQKK